MIRARQHVQIPRNYLRSVVLESDRYLGTLPKKLRDLTLKIYMRTTGFRADDAYLRQLYGSKLTLKDAHLKYGPKIDKLLDIHRQR